MDKLKNILKRSIGIILFAFIPGMAAGAPTVGWLLGGVTGVLTVFSSIIIYFGVQLAWDAEISQSDIEKGFRAAVAKAASENKDIAAATQLTETVEAAPAVPQIPAEEAAPAPVAEPVVPAVAAPAADPYAPTV